MTEEEYHMVQVLVDGAISYLVLGIEVKVRRVCFVQPALLLVYIFCF